MTVREFIEELQKVRDKDSDVSFVFGKAFDSVNLDEIYMIPTHNEHEDGSDSFTIFFDNYNKNLGK